MGAWLSPPSVTSELTAWEMLVDQKPGRLGYPLLPRQPDLRPWWSTRWAAGAEWQPGEGEVAARTGSRWGQTGGHGSPPIWAPLGAPGRPWGPRSQGQAFSLTPPRAQPGETQYGDSGASSRSRYWHLISSPTASRRNAPEGLGSLV